MRDVIEIETDRLTLRALRMGDAPRIARFCGDPGVGRMLAMTPLPYFDVAAEGWIMLVHARAPRELDFVFAIERKGEGLIGALGAHGKEAGGYEIGYWLGRPYWGRGFATEALTGLIAEARALGPLHAGHFVDNPASGRVLEKTGFAYTGETLPQFSLARGESVQTKRMLYVEPEVRAFGTAHAAVAH